MRKAMYAMSGDPIHYGHIDIVERAAKVFDKVVVGIGLNQDKKGSHLFSLDERLEMAKKVLEPLKNVEVLAFKGLLVHYAFEHGIDVVVKGVRDSVDVGYEMGLHQLGESQELGIDTFLLPAKPHLAHVSSRGVKAMRVEEGLTHKFVPLHVKQKLEERLLGRYTVGVTGEIGCGKSYVTKQLLARAAERGIEAHVVGLDEVGHEILGTLGDEAYVRTREAIVKTFGEGVRLPNGMINRKALGDIVFNDYDALRKLNALMEKPMMVRMETDKLYGKKGLILVDAALLAESQLMHLSNNNVLLVTAAKEVQEERLRARDLTEEQIARRKGSQYNREEKEKAIRGEIEKHRHGTLWVYDNSGIGGDCTKLFDEITQGLGIKRGN